MIHPGFQFSTLRPRPCSSARVCPFRSNDLDDLDREIVANSRRARRLLLKPLPIEAEIRDSLPSRMAAEMRESLCFRFEMEME